METIREKAITFEQVTDRVQQIAGTERTYMVASPDDIDCQVDSFTEYGLQTLGKAVGFPALFIRQMHETSPFLANTVVSDRVYNYFRNDTAPAFYAREFGNDSKIHGVVSNRYSYFDDKECMEILGGSELSKLAFQNTIITPERFHARAIDIEHPFHIAGDKSNLFFCFFIDNSMLGQSSFKVQLGVYRQICTNGMIVPVREFILCKQVHRGRKDIAAEFQESVAFLEAKQDNIKSLLLGLADSTATIEELKGDFRNDYIAKGLNTNKKETEKVLTLYETYAVQYGRNSKWAMVNAVTEFARDIKDINRREYLEKSALRVA